MVTLKIEYRFSRCSGGVCVCGNGGGGGVGRGGGGGVGGV